MQKLQESFKEAEKFVSSSVNGNMHVQLYAGIFA